MVDEQKSGPPIIIVRKKAAHAGHHGGAWKVAYADFVTAMMALFIVLWLMSSSEQTKKAIGGYFQDPKGYGKQIGSTLAGAGESLSVTKSQMTEIKKKLEEALKRAPEFQSLKDHVSLTVTGEGLRIELLETEKGIFFNSGSAKPSEFGLDLIARLAAELGKLPNGILLEGHTDSQPFSEQTDYTNWELSSDRANAARRIMQRTGLRSNQVGAVRGYADQRLRNPKDSKDPSNRRISVIVEYTSNTPGLADAAAEEPKKKTEAPGKGLPGKDQKPPKPDAAAKPTATAAKPQTPAKPTATTAKPQTPAKPAATTAKPQTPAKPTATAAKPQTPAKKK